MSAAASARDARPSGAVVLTEQELRAWGERFGREVELPSIVALSGELGAGKTTLAQAICRGFGVTGDVTSPTFALVHEHDAPRGRVHHVDLYRLEGPRDLANLGWDDLVGEHALVLIEWPERAEHRLPPSAIRIELGHVAGDATRRSLRVERP